MPPLLLAHTAVLDAYNAVLDAHGMLVLDAQYDIFDKLVIMLVDSPVLDEDPVVWLLVVKDI
jgi:hypothetical protein